MEQKLRLLKILEQFKNKKILVIGDIMLDKYIWGDVSRISPEAPVQVVNVVKETYEPGGASNVANNIASLGGNSFMVGIAGNDDAKDILLQELKKRKINAEGIFTDKDKPTIQKIRIMGRSQQLLRVDYEKKEHVHKDIENLIIEFLKKIVKDVDVIVISDYAKGVITNSICSKLIKLAEENNKPIIVDPKPKHRDLYSNVTLMTPNNLEASEMAGIEDGTDDAIAEIGSRLLKQLDKNGNITHIPTKAKEVYSIIGAGDTVVSTLALALASGAELKDAAMLANIAAGIKVGKIGTASVSIGEIKKELDRL